MSASRKDFIAIAKGIRITFSEDAREMARVDPGLWQWMRTRAAQRMADVLVTTSPNFDRDRFVEACKETL